MYSLVKKALFSLDGETAHELTLDGLNALTNLGLSRLISSPRLEAPVKVMGLEFPNPVGLAAGLDKNADYLNSLDKLGFGFIEVGTVTPQPQPGNPKPRLFRLPEGEALINRMGFNNKGLAHLIAQVKRQPTQALLGINLGKNLSTPVEQAGADYLTGFEQVYSLADYVTINISSPNTPGLRDLQYGAALKELLQPLKEAQARLSDSHQRYVPLAVKIAPDMEEDELVSLSNCLLDLRIDAVIATNTTLDKTQVATLKYGAEAGGLSGRPLTAKALELTANLANILEGQIPIIGVGGIFNGADALARIEAGASLVQLYTGFVYRGPKLIGECVEAIAAKAANAK